MSASEKLAIESLHKWLVEAHGVGRVDLVPKQIRVHADGTDRLFLVLENGVEVFGERLPPTAANHLANLLRSPG
jgi:hypothetical protein